MPRKTIPGKLLSAVAVVAIALLINAVTISAGPAQNYFQYLPREGTRCASPQELSVVLRSEGHQFVATMERFTVNTDTGETQPLAQFITATEDGSRFYFLEGNVPLEVPDGVFCITLAGRDLEVNDYRQDRPPQVTRFTFDPSDAALGCEYLEREAEVQTCAHRDTILRNAYDQDGMRLALQGTLLAEDGSEFALLTLIADPENGQDFASLTTLEGGATTIFGSGSRFALVPEIVETFDQPNK